MSFRPAIVGVKANAQPVCRSPPHTPVALAELTGELREGLGTLAIVLGCRCWPR
jgi:hypothetical protein